MATAKVNIPYPINRYVAYDWEAGSKSGNGSTYGGAFWERRRQKLISQLNVRYTSYTDNLPELISVGNNVKDIGLAERKKEQAFIQANLPDFDLSSLENNPTQYITTLNEIVQGKDQFKYALDRIHAAIEMGKKTHWVGTKKEYYKNLAPTMSALFMSYLTTEVTSRMRNIAKTFTPSQAVIEWKIQLDTIIEESIDAAMEKMLEKSQATSNLDQIYGDSEQWKAIGEAYKQLTTFQNQMKGMLKKQLNLDKLRTIFDDAAGQQILKKTRRNKRKTGGFAEAIGWKSQQLSNTVGGNVNEYIRAIVEESAPKSATITERGTSVLQGKVAKTDITQFWQYEAEINANLEDVIGELETELSDSTSLKNAAERFQEFYDNNLANLSQNNFYIMSNVKMGSLGHGFSGFHNGEKMPLERLGDYIDSAGIDIAHAHDFVNVAYNTLENAIFANEREEVQENIQKILVSAAAKLLFDDWSTIGAPNSGTQVLNFFDIDGIIIPSSYFFINLGQAMIEAAESMQSVNNPWISAYVNLPETVVYEGDWRQFGTTNEEIKTGIWGAWNEQAQKAREESYFTTKFLKNFKSLITSGF